MPRKRAVRETEARTRRVPHWDKKLRELWFGKVLVKRFVVPAESQEIILDAFQAEGWLGCIDDPLPWQANGEAKSRLRAAVRHLNSCHAYQVIRFRSNGKGTGIRWEHIT